MSVMGKHTETVPEKATVSQPFDIVFWVKKGEVKEDGVKVEWPEV